MWLSNNGWEHPVQVNNGKAQKAKLGHSEKAWLKACWNVVVAEEQRRERSKKLQEPNAFEEKLVPRTLPPHEELVADMGNLFDALIQTDAAPDCSRTEFMYGWTRFIEYIAQLEAKYKARLAIDSDNSTKSPNKK